MHAGKLFKGVDVGILISFGRRISRSDAQSLGAGNGADYSNVPFAPVSEITECRIYHTGEPYYIGLYRISLDIGIEVVILMSDTGTMQIQVHTT